MMEFVRRWRSGEPRAKAWREAQLSLLHSRDFSNPYFWAAFTLTGQWRCAAVPRIPRGETLRPALRPLRCFVSFC